MCEHILCKHCVHCIACDAWLGIVARQIGKPCDNHLHCECGAQPQAYDVLDLSGEPVAAVRCTKCGRVELFSAVSPYLRKLQQGRNVFITGC